jgi:hypothetical protein
MLRNTSLALALLLACTVPAAADTSVYAGLQGLLLTGTHTDIAGSQHGIAGGAFLELGARVNRLDTRIEGVPPVSLPQAPSEHYGQATPQFSLLNGTFRYAVDRNERLWLGVGGTIINQRTPLPNLDQVVSSRLAGARYEVRYRVDTATNHFFEAVFGAAPHLTGTDYYIYSIPQPAVDRPEVAAEEDAMIAFGLRRGSDEWLVGLRTINFSAKFVLTGDAADRNNGGGPILEWRRLLR